jgi:antitoxin component YwqK of YwqJK toxin-antitoxin module
MKILKFLLIGIILFTKFATAQKKVTTYWGFSNIVKEIYFVDAQGILNGNYKLWSKEGVLYSDYTFLKGEKNGLCIDYSGKRGDNDYTLGIVSLCNGKAMEEIMYKNGKKTWRNYYTCIDGKQILVHKEIALDSKMSSFVSYYPNGIVNEQYNKSSDFESKATGNYKKFFATGKIEISGYYKNGKKNGYWFELSAKGDTVYSATYNNDVELTHIKFYGKRPQSEKNMDTSFNFSTIVHFDTNGRKEKKEFYKVYPETRMNLSQGIHKSRWGYYLAEVINYNDDSSADTSHFYLVPKIKVDKAQKVQYVHDAYGDTVYQTLDEKQYISYKQLIEAEVRKVELEKIINDKKGELENIQFPELMRGEKPNLYETYKLLNENYFYHQLQNIKYTIRFFNGEDEMNTYVSNVFPNKSELDNILSDEATIAKTVSSLQNRQISLLDLQISANNKILDLTKLSDTKDIEKKLRKLNYPPIEVSKIFIVLGVNN